MRCKSGMSAAVLAGIAGMAAAQPTIDGVLSPSEMEFYGPIRWEQTVPTGFGDAAAGEFTGGVFGNPADVTTGVEICIPKSQLDGASSFRITGWVNSGDRTFLSNQIIGSLPVDTTNIGGRPLDWASSPRFPGNQFVSVSGVPMGTATVDGTLDAGYQRYFLQGNFTGFGNNQNATEDGRGGSGNGSEIDALYVLQDANNVYLFIAGNLEANGNGLDLFIDTDNGASGAAGLNSGSGDGAFIVNSQTGMIFDTGFNPDVVVSVDATDPDGAGPMMNSPRLWYGTNTGGDDFQIDNQGTLAGYGAANAGTLNGIGLAVNNSNIDGVLGVPGNPSPVSPNANWAYGNELDNLRARIDTTTNRLYVFVGGNANVGFEKFSFFFDAAPGGQNELLDNNPDISFGALPRMGLRRDGTTGEIIENGLRFDADFTADYWFNINTGVDGGSGNLINFTDSAVLRTDGKARDLFGGTIDYGCFRGGTITNGSGMPVMGAVELMSFDGPNIDAQPGTVENLFSSFAPRESFRAVQINPLDPASVPPTPGLLQTALDNSNTGGVTETTAESTAVRAVSSGFEISIDLDELGWDGEQDIKIAAWCASGGFDFLSNQILGDPPASNDNIGEVRAVNFADETRFPGLQYVNLSAPVGPMGCNPADLSEEFGTLDINDILVFAGAFNAMDPSADFFPGGGFDINDILTFAGFFNAGCP